MDVVVVVVFSGGESERICTLSAHIFLHVFWSDRRRRRRKIRREFFRTRRARSAFGHLTFRARTGDSKIPLTARRCMCGALPGCGTTAVGIRAALATMSLPFVSRSERSASSGAASLDLQASARSVPQRGILVPHRESTVFLVRNCSKFGRI